MKKGYKAEYEVKKALFRKYTPEMVFKVAIGGTIDFFVLGKNKKILKLIEVKKTEKNRWYPNEHDLKQFKALKQIQKRHKIPVEYWIKIKGEWQILDLKKIQRFFD